jgi:hypothetical protein
MKATQIKTITEKHIRKIDKFYRMFSGLSSELIEYNNDVIHLKIKVSKKWPKDSLTTAKQIAQDWKDFNSELKDAKSFVVEIYHISGSTGFVIDPKKRPDKEHLEESIKSLLSDDENSTNYETIKGVFF